MNKSDFEIIKANLEARIEACKQTLGLITEDNPIENLTVAQLKAAKAFVKDEYVKQSNILLIDLYHVIGMGNLSATQLGVFTKLIKEYASYRPDLNALEKWTGNLYNLPKIPKRTKFKLKELGLELVAGRGGEIEEISESLPSEESIEEKLMTEDVRDNVAGITPIGVYKVSENAIIIDKDDVTKFSEFIVNHKLFKTQAPLLIEQHIKQQKQYGGLYWMLKGNDYWGIPEHKSTKDSLRDFYKNLGRIV